MNSNMAVALFLDIPLIIAVGVAVHCVLSPKKICIPNFYQIATDKFKPKFITEVTQPILFSKGQVVEHVKTKGLYTIEILPDEAVLEHSHEPAYGYRMKDGRLCFRCQSEMEDGRFRMYTFRKNRDV